MRQLLLYGLMLLPLFGVAQTDTTADLVKDTTRLKYELRTLYTTQKAGRQIDLDAPTYSLLSVDKPTNTVLINIITDMTTSVPEPRW